MTVSIVPARTPLTAILVSLLLTGCAYRSEHHAAGIGYRSIKDDPEPRAVDKHAVAPRGITAAPTKPRPKPQATVTPRILPSVDKAASHKAHAVPATTPAIEQPKPSAPPAMKSAAATPAPPPAPSVAPPSVPPPAAPAIAQAPVAPSSARSTDQAPATQAAPANPQRSEAERATVDIRRGNPAIASAPPAAPTAPLASVEPPPAKPAAPPIVIQQKPSAAPADAPAQPKIAALTDDQRVHDTIARAREYMAGGRLINARSLLQDAARDNNPLLLTALAETFDPLHLRDQFPSLARSAEPTRALDFYRRASERGSTAAAQKLKSLAEFLAANPGFMKQ